MRAGWVRIAAAVAGLVLAVTAVAGCEDGGDGDSGKATGGGPLGKPVPTGRATGAEPSAVAPGAPPLRFLTVKGETPGACPSGSADAYPDPQGGSCLIVVPDSGMTARPASAKATLEKSAAGFVVTVGLTKADAKRFARLTAELAQRQPPANRLALFREDKLLSAPSVMSSISGGSLQISGSFTRESAEKLARDIRGG